MYQYECTACQSIFPDKQTYLNHKRKMYQDSKHDGSTYHRLSPEVPVFKRPFSRLENGYRCNKCGLIITGFAARQDTLVHVAKCDGPPTPQPLTSQYDNTRKLEFTVGNYMHHMEQVNHWPEFQYKPELHQVYVPSQKERAEWRRYIEKIEDDLDRAEGKKPERRPTPLQKMSYAIHLGNWERVKSAAYDLAYDMARRERLEIYDYIRHCHALDADTAEWLIEYLEKERQFTRDLGPKFELKKKEVKHWK